MRRQAQQLSQRELFSKVSHIVHLVSNQDLNSMDAFSNSSVINNHHESHFGLMVIGSIFFHVIIFLSILYLPEQMPTRRIKNTIYRVDLVEMPVNRGLKEKTRARGKKNKSLVAVKKKALAKRVSVMKKKKPVVVAKRTLPKKKIKNIKPSSSELIKNALEKIKNKVTTADKLAKTVSKAEVKETLETEATLIGNQPNSSITMRIYRMAVETKIKDNWVYPAALVTPNTNKKIEAIVVVMVKRNGAILKSWFKKRTSNVIFDASVLKAIEKSNPLPSFPEGYNRSYDDIEITFNLNDMVSL